MATASMKVRVVTHANDSDINGNILWESKFPMRGGKFPADHPCVDDPGIGMFRNAGYWASCFPEGDGITYRALNGQSAEQQRKHIEECFGWTIVERFA